MRVIAVANQKGGCGKTTTSINLASALALLGKKVLLIDNDPQAHSTLGLGIDADNLTISMFDVFDLEKTHVGISDVVIKRSENLDLAPSQVILSVIEQKISGTQRRERRLREKLDQLGNVYDFVIIDCTPSIGLLTFNALYAADEVIVPVEPSFFSYHGLKKLLESISIVNRMKRDHAEMVVHALITMYDGKTFYENQIIHKIKTLFSDRVFQTPIRRDVSLQEAAEMGKSVIDLYPNGSGYADYMSIAVELMDAQLQSVSEPKMIETIFPRVGYMDEDSVYAQLMRGEGEVFSLYAPEAKRVEIAGDFVVWIPQMMRQHPGKKGVWWISIPLKAGVYSYKFIVDGEWMLDPENPDTVSDGFNGKNSVVEMIDVPYYEEPRIMVNEPSLVTV